MIRALRYAVGLVAAVGLALGVNKAVRFIVNWWNGY